MSQIQYVIHHDHDAGRPIRFAASSDRAAKGAARRALRAAGYRVDSTFAEGVQGYNLGRHEGCATAVLVRVEGVR